MTEAWRDRGKAVGSRRWRPAATGMAIKRAGDPMFEQAGNECRGWAKRA